MSRPRIPSRTACWNWARLMSVIGGGLWQKPLSVIKLFSRVRARVIAWIAVERVLALLQLQVEGSARDARADGGREVHLDAPDRVDELAKAVEVDDRHLVDVDAEELLDRADGQLGAAGRVGGVDLVLRLARDLGERVARDRQLSEGAAAGPEQHQGVGAVGRAVGRRRLAAPAASRQLFDAASSAPANWPERMSVPITRIVCGLTARNGLPCRVFAHVDQLPLLDLRGDLEGQRS